MSSWPDDIAGYDSLHREFRWRIPERFNIGVACCDAHDPAALALVERLSSGETREYTFGRIAELSNRLANGLRALGVHAGDRVGIVLPQCAYTGIAHLAVYKLGAIAVPLSMLFGPQALAYRLGDGAARAVIADPSALDALAEVAADLPDLQIVVAGPAAPPYHALSDLLADGAAAFTPAATTPETPALLIYTSGTTGAPKGALHGHRVLLGHLPGFELSHEFFPREGDRFWTPADWAWIGGLMDALMPSWYHGRPVVAAARARFDPEWALALMAELRVRNAFLPPTAMKLTREAGVRNDGLALRSVMSGGEPLGAEMLSWAREVLGVAVNEIYGQTEANYLVGNCSSVWEVRPGSMGRPYPGHRVTVVDADGQPVRSGEVGQIALEVPDPVAFLGYWGREEATREKHTSDGRRLLTGDLAHRDEDGYLWFQARADDVITSAGYRIGPAEIEECIMHHPAVAMAAVIGVPDRVRGQVVKAFIQLAGGHEPSPELEGEIQRLVRTQLAAYEYPRAIEFVRELPLTTTGKIRRADLRRLEEARNASPT